MRPAACVRNVCLEKRWNPKIKGSKKREARLPRINVNLKLQVTGQWTAERRAPGPMPLGFGPHPGGMRDNSPMFQHWEEPANDGPVPKGRLRRRFSRPFGT